MSKWIEQVFEVSSLGSTGDSNNTKRDVFVTLNSIGAALKDGTRRCGSAQLYVPREEGKELHIGQQFRLVGVTDDQATE